MSKKVKDVLDPMRAYRCKNCTEKSVEHIAIEIKRFYAVFLQRLMTELTDVLKREHEAAKNVVSVSKSLMTRRIILGLYRGVVHNNFNLKNRILDHISISFHNLSGYEAHRFIKKLGKSLI